jgi:glyoxylase-like metal-dependent hydrolase (beta-lactamase superfamily II)
MKHLTDDLSQLRGLPANAFNVYLMGGVLVDAGTRHAGRRILRQLRGHTVTAHALTHVHPDHQGASRQVCEALGIPLWCGAADADAMETGRIWAQHPAHWSHRLLDRVWTGPAFPVARRLREGDEVGGFIVLETPGHTAGHISFWRSSDRVLVLGDVLTNMRVLTGVPGLREPATIYTPDPERNRESARRLAALEPALVCFGHGPPLRDVRKFTSFVAALRDGEAHRCVRSGGGRSS